MAGAVRRAVTAGTRPRGRRGHGPAAQPGERLDLYEHGVTTAIGGRIQVVRYDTTEVYLRPVPSARGGTRACVLTCLTDADGEPVVLPDGGFGPPEWQDRIRRAVTGAQVPRALDALTRGARLTFGAVWITEDAIGTGGVSLRWTQVQRLGVVDDRIALRATGQWQVWPAVASSTPNLFVLRALTERLAGTAPGDGGRADD
ncbi:DUF6585 family protein [Streptomyces pyxinae]|uniref:DUF6585 family protein n=1 Tax=Streptomyces pyxinae TaxID=2970734 RepID=UPI002867E789|nr:DUF6585 family protein [Streptomyces sp. LP05-1]